MCRIKNYILLLSLLPACLCAESVSKNFNHPNSPYAWVSAGVFYTLSLKSDYAGYTAAIMPTIQYNKHVFSARRLFSFANESESYWPSRHFTDTSLLYGRCAKNNHSFSCIAIGPSYIEGMERGEKISGQTYKKKPFHTIGLAIDVQAFVICPIAGFGVCGICNLNTQQPYWAALLCISAGRILSFKPQK